MTFFLKVEQSCAVKNRKISECGCSAGTPSPQLRSVDLRRQRPRDQARPARITQPESCSGVRLGNHRAVAVRLGGAGTKSLPGGGRGLPASPRAGSPRSPRGSGPLRGAGRSGGRDAAEEGRPPGQRGSASGAGWEDWDASTPLFLLALSPLPCLWASSHRSRRQRGPELGRLSESLLAGVSCVLRLRSSLQVGMEKGWGLESRTRLVFQLVEILLFSPLALRFRSASWPGPALPPLRKEATRSSQHCGDCSPGMRKEGHVLLARPHLL